MSNITENYYQNKINKHGNNIPTYEEFYEDIILNDNA